MSRKVLEISLDIATVLIPVLVSDTFEISAHFSITGIDKVINILEIAHITSL